MSDLSQIRGYDRNKIIILNHLFCNKNSIYNDIRNLGLDDNQYKNAISFLKYVNAVTIEQESGGRKRKFHNITPFGMEILLNAEYITSEEYDDYIKKHRLNEEKETDSESKYDDFMEGTIEEKYDKYTKLTEEDLLYGDYDDRIEVIHNLINDSDWPEISFDNNHVDDVDSLISNASNIFKSAVNQKLIRGNDLMVPDLSYYQDFWDIYMHDPMRIDDFIDKLIENINNEKLGSQKERLRHDVMNDLYILFVHYFFDINYLQEAKMWINKYYHLLNQKEKDKSGLAEESIKKFKLDVLKKYRLSYLELTEEEIHFIIEFVQPED